MLSQNRGILKTEAMMPVKRRSELSFRDQEQDPIREFGLWLLWAGLTPESKLPVSAIGIYTDFT